MVMKAAPAGRQRPQVVVVEMLVSYYRYVNLILRMLTSLRRMGGQKTTMDRTLIVSCKTLASKAGLEESSWVGHDRSRFLSGWPKAFGP